MDKSFALFIDGAYLNRRTGGEKLDFRVFKTWFEEHMKMPMSEGYYFDSDGSRDREKFHSFLQRNCNIRVKNYWTSPTELFWPDHLGGGRVLHPQSRKPYVLVRQKAVDVALGYFLATSWHHRRWTNLVMIAGDADFIEPIRDLVEGKGVQMSLVGDSASLSPHLVSYATEVFHLEDKDSDLMKSIVM